MMLSSSSGYSSDLIFKSYFSALPSHPLYLTPSLRIKQLAETKKACLKNYENHSLKPLKNALMQYIEHRKQQKRHGHQRFLPLPIKSEYDKLPPDIQEAFFKRGKAEKEKVNLVKATLDYLKDPNQLTISRLQIPLEVITKKSGLSKLICQNTNTYRKNLLLVLRDSKPSFELYMDILKKLNLEEIRLEEELALLKKGFINYLDEKTHKFFVSYEKLIILKDIIEKDLVDQTLQGKAFANIPHLLKEPLFPSLENFLSIDEISAYLSLHGTYLHLSENLQKYIIQPKEIPSELKISLQAKLDQWCLKVSEAVKQLNGFISPIQEHKEATYG